MKKHLPAVLSCLSLLTAVLCLFGLLSLKEEISRLRRELSDRLSSVTQNVSNIYSNVDALLRESENLLADSGWEWTGCDLESKTARLSCHVLPKEFSDGTAAFLAVNGEEIPMEWKNGRFEAEPALPLFEESRIIRVLLRDGETTRVQMLDWYLSPRYELLPNCYASLNGSTFSSPADKEALYSCEGQLDVDVTAPAGFSIREAALVTLLDGKETGRMALDPNSRETSDNVGAAQAETAPFSGEWVNLSFSALIDETYRIPFGTVQELLVELKGSDGLIYRMTVDRWLVDEEGSAQPDEEDWLWRNMEAVILSADREILWQPETFE